MLRLLWSHCRNINVNVSQDVVKYYIPIYSEADLLGRFKSIKVKDREIVLEFYTKRDGETTCQENKKVYVE